MEYITYYLSAFDAAQAQIGKLCVATSYAYSGASISTDSADYRIATVPTMISSNDFRVVINGVTCSFDNQGYPKDLSSKNYRLWMASTEQNVEQYGNAVRRAKKVVTTKGADGTYSTNEDAGQGGNIMIATLTPRDNFAMQALRAIIPTLPDLKNISDTERTFYCNLAYQWAANMMDRAAQSRADFVDETAEPTTTGVDVGELENNTEKLLNNIVATLEKTQRITIDGEHQIVSERVSIPELNNILNDYLHHEPEDVDDNQERARFEDLVNAIRDIDTSGSSEVSISNNGLGRDANYPLHMSVAGISDIVTQLTNINTALGNLTTVLNNQNTTLGQIKTAIENLELSPTINNNIVVPEPTPAPEPSNNTEEE